MRASRDRVHSRGRGSADADPRRERLGAGGEWAPRHNPSKIWKVVRRGAGPAGAAAGYLGAALHAHNNAFHPVVDEMKRV